MDNFRLKTATLLLLFSLILTAGASPANDQPERNDTVSFSWSFNAFVGPENDRKPVPVTRYNTFKKGDLLKISLAPKTKCFIYLLYRSTEDEISMLFPPDFNFFDGHLKLGKVYGIPPGGNAFRLDGNSGIETFYLIASKKRLIDIERSYGKYNLASGGEKKAFSRDILSQIRTLKLTKSQLPSSAERPVMIGGNLRGFSNTGTNPNQWGNELQIEVSTPDVYIKTFTIKLQ